MYLRFSNLTGLILALAASGLLPTRAAASGAHLSFERLWVRSVSPNADSAPVYASRPLNGSCRAGTRNCAGSALVYVLAANNTSNCNPGDPVTKASLYAFNAATGKLKWTQSTTGASRCTTAAPVVDPNRRWVYATGLDGKVHRYSALSGKEYRSHGWPEGVTLMPDVEKTAAAPTIGNGRIYVTTSGFIGDAGHYEGHLVSVNLVSGKTNVFNALCSNLSHLLSPSPSSRYYCSSVEAGLFGRGQAAVDPVSHDVYIVSGNGPWNGRTNWGDSILKVDPTGKRLLDSYTPTNQASLANGDLDLGSTGPALLPAIRRGSHVYHLLVQGGKGPACDGCGGVAVRLLNRDNLSGKHAPGQLGGDLADVQAPGSCEILTEPRVWKRAGQIWVFYANDCGTAGYRISSPSAGVFRISRIWSVNTRGTTPILHAGDLYVAHDHAVDVYNPLNGSLISAAGGIGTVHWEYPLAAANRLYITDESGHLTAFAIH